MNSKVAAAGTGKVQFESFTLAKGVATRRGPKKHDGREPYHCGHCHKWHIGNSSKATKGHADAVWPAQDTLPPRA